MGRLEYVMTLDLINEILSWICLFTLLWSGYILLVNKGVPNIRTAPVARRRIIERLKADYEAKKETQAEPYTIMDLGSGSGIFAREIAKAMPEARVIGLELSPVSHAKAQKEKMRQGLENLTHERADFYARDLSDLDAVVFFLNAYEMGRLAEKLDHDLKKGAMAVSNRFRLHKPWEPEETVPVQTFRRGQKEFHIYRKV